MNANSGTNETAKQNDVTIAAKVSSKVSTLGSSYNLLDSELVGLEIVDPDRATDVLSQFRANIHQVEELNARLRFVLGEISSLAKRR